MSTTSYRNSMSANPKSVVDRVLNSDLSYEGLVADEEFLRNIERDSFADLAGDHPGPLMNELAAPVQVADVASVIASMKKSSDPP